MAQQTNTGTGLAQRIANQTEKTKEADNTGSTRKKGPYKVTFTPRQKQWDGPEQGRPPPERNTQAYLCPGTKR